MWENVIIVRKDGQNVKIGMKYVKKMIVLVKIVVMKIMSVKLKIIMLKIYGIVKITNLLVIIKENVLIQIILKSAKIDVLTNQKTQILISVKIVINNYGK